MKRVPRTSTESPQAYWTGGITGSSNFTKGIKTHVLADIKAHDTTTGYIQQWVPILANKLQEADDPMATDEEALHLALEFAVDSILINEQGLQLNDLLFSYSQANFLEKSVKVAFKDMGYSFPNGLDVSTEFKKYLALVRILEKAARLYAGCLTQGKVDERILSILESSEFLDAERELSDGALGLYLQVLPILVNYPMEIRDTLMGVPEGLNLMDLLGDMEGFCESLDNCP